MLAVEVVPVHDRSVREWVEGSNCPKIGVSVLGSDWATAETETKVGDGE